MLAGHPFNGLAQTPTPTPTQTEDKKILRSIIQSYYLSNLQLLDYSVSEGKLTIASHAPIDLRVIGELKDNIGINDEFDDFRTNMESLKGLIETINVKFQSLLNNAPEYFSAILNQPSHPVYKCIWSRYENLTAGEMEYGEDDADFTIAWRHGHDACGHIPDDFIARAMRCNATLTNLDTNEGKNFWFDGEESLTTHLSQGLVSPAEEMDLEQFKADILDRLNKYSYLIANTAYVEFLAQQIQNLDELEADDIIKFVADQSNAFNTADSHTLPLCPAILEAVVKMVPECEDIAALKVQFIATLTNFKKVLSNQSHKTALKELITTVRTAQNQSELDSALQGAFMAIGSVNVDILMDIFESADEPPPRPVSPEDDSVAEVGLAAAPDVSDDSETFEERKRDYIERFQQMVAIISSPSYKKVLTEQQAITSTSSNDVRAEDEEQVVAAAASAYPYAQELAAALLRALFQHAKEVEEGVSFHQAFVEELQNFLDLKAQQEPLQALITKIDAAQDDAALGKVFGDFQELNHVFIEKCLPRVAPIIELVSTATVAPNIEQEIDGLFDEMSEFIAVAPSPGSTVAKYNQDKLMASLIAELKVSIDRASGLDVQSLLQNILYDVGTKESSDELLDILSDINDRYLSDDRISAETFAEIEAIWGAAEKASKLPKA